MASRMTNFHSNSNSNYPYFPSHNPIRNSDGVFQFDDSEVWVNSANGPAGGGAAAIAAESRRMMSTIPREPRRNKTTFGDQTTAGAMTSASLPVNIPDWSKILKEGSGGKKRDVSDEIEEEEDDVDERVPPHEYLARSRGASFSVHEGVGRTLKGRDLRRVRNAIWKQVGFED